MPEEYDTTIVDEDGKPIAMISATAVFEEGDKYIEAIRYAVQRQHNNE